MVVALSRVIIFGLGQQRVGSYYPKVSWAKVAPPNQYAWALACAPNVRFVFCQCQLGSEKVLHGLPISLGLVRIMAWACQYRLGVKEWRSNLQVSLGLASVLATWAPKNCFVVCSSDLGRGRAYQSVYSALGDEGASHTSPVSLGLASILARAC